MDDKIKEVFKEFVDERILDMTIFNISKMDERMNRGLELVYPEEKLDFLKCLLESTIECYDCVYIDNALTIMESLERNDSVEDSYKFICDYNDIGYNFKVRNFVLLWSKRGPEFFVQTSPCNFEELSSEDKQFVYDIEQTKAKYRLNELLASKKKAKKIKKTSIE